MRGPGISWKGARPSGSSLPGPGPQNGSHVNIVTTGRYKPHTDPPAAGSGPRPPLLIREAGLGPAGAHPPASRLAPFSPSPPGSCLNTLKQSKSNYREQAACEHLLHPSPGITNAPALSADRRRAPRAPRVARCSRAVAPPRPPPRGAARAAPARVPSTAVTYSDQ